MTKWSKVIQIKPTHRLFGKKAKYYCRKQTLHSEETIQFQNVSLVKTSENEKKLEATSSCLKQQLQELQLKLETSQLQEQSKICALNRQLAACKSELAEDAADKERMKAEMEIFKGNF